MNGLWDFIRENPFLAVAGFLGAIALVCHTILVATGHPGLFS